MGILILTCVTITAYAAVFLSTFIRIESLSELAVLRQHSTNSRKLRLSLLYWGSPVFFVGLWSLLSLAGVTPNELVPSPEDLISAFWRLSVSGVLLEESWASLQRVIIGFSLAAITGVIIGFFAGSFLVARQTIAPLNSVLRYIPPTSFIVLLIVYFGVGELYKYAVVFAGVVFFIIQMTIDVIDDIDGRHIEMARSTGFSNWSIFYRIIAPCSAPRVFDILRINLSAAWTFLVAAELVGSDHGLGHLVAISQRFMRIDELFAGIITFGIIGLLTDAGLELASRKLFPWYHLSLNRGA